MRKILYYIRNKRRQGLQILASFIVKQIATTPSQDNKLMWFSMGLTLDTYCIVAFKMYLD